MGSSKEHITLDGNLGYSREQMPQIHPAMVGHYILWLMNYGFEVSGIHEVPVENVLPTQDKINRLRLQKKVALGAEDPTNLKTLILAKGGHQLDGHNTVQALKELGQPRLRLPCYRVRASMDRVIEATKHYPFVTYKSIDQID